MRMRVHILSLAAVATIAALFAATAFAPLAYAQDDMAITSSGVGGAIVGSTVEELAEQLGDEYEISDEVRITVDFTGHVVSRGGTVQFRAVKANEPGDELSLFIVNNPAFMTAEGVGPGSTIAEAEEIYGNATLNRNPENESREFVVFENQSEERIAFRTPGIAGTYVGEYDGEAVETENYDDEGVIAAVWISCQPGRNCPGDDGAATATDDGDDATSDETDDDDTDADATEGDDADATDDEGDDATEDADAADDDDDDAAAAADDSGADEASSPLPETGSEQVVLVTASSLLLLIGGGFVLLNRRFLAPNWLGSGRW